VLAWYVIDGQVSLAAKARNLFQATFILGTLGYLQVKDLTPTSAQRFVNRIATADPLAIFTHPSPLI
jgi:hypothetical protein